MQLTEYPTFLKLLKKSQSSINHDVIDKKICSIRVYKRTYGNV